MIKYNNAVTWIHMLLAFGKHRLYDQIPFCSFTQGLLANNVTGCLDPRGYSEDVGVHLGKIEFYEEVHIEAVSSARELLLGNRRQKFLGEFVRIAQQCFPWSNAVRFIENHRFHEGDTQLLTLGRIFTELTSSGLFNKVLERQFLEITRLQNLLSRNEKRSYCSR